MTQRGIPSLDPENEMNINADRLAKQVKLAYEFMEALHGQALALIKDVETQLAQAPEELQCLRPGGYRYAINEQSLTLERPQAAITDFYAVCFRHFAGRPKGTPLDGSVPPIGFLKIVFRERGLEHPEVRFGIFTNVEKPAERTHEWPSKFEDVVNHVTRRALVGTAWSDRETLRQTYQDSYISFMIQGMGVKLADLPDSEAIAERIVEPLLAMYREAI
jgi:hypothetical protein